MLVLAVRRALPTALVGSTGWITHQIAHNLLTTCAMALAATALSSAVLDRGSWRSICTRAELLAAGILVAVASLYRAAI
jgi:hypothetical protein